ncbi:hypothetical protein [Gordonibacter massiliensis (ex Traore et al. 2017)]|uniref:hypothetical protein n=1 Tax=Gordonibacter massiliensis (ex Traore et al. 2017) TaxID=1841863 RepID=UPI001C8B294E|nr:hypothetical protein [Gordonibacter massiliensis (ex Traore et al. 2017)]MBX9034606.1 hypothetical protein [Gordonibacter massiliensis (ex Traore et al. 2017)]
MAPITMQNSELRKEHALHAQKSVFVVRALILMGAMMALIVNCCEPGNLSSAFAAVMTILLSFYLVIIARKNWLLVVVFFFVALCCYSFCIVNYFDIQIISPYVQLRGTLDAFTGINVMLVFLTCITVLMPLRINVFPRKFVFIDPKRESATVAIACGACVIATGLLGLGEAYGIGSRIRITSIYEYAVILFMLGLFFSGGNRKTLVFLTCALVFRVFLDFSIGGRITSIELVSVWFLMVVSDRVNIRKVAPFAVLAFVIMLTVGELRGDSFSLDATLQGVRDFSQAGFAWDGAYSAYYTSLTFLSYENMVSVAERLHSFFLFLASIVLGGSVEGSNLALVTREGIWNMGGGYYPFFFHYYLGWGGVVVFSLLLGAILRFMANMGDGRPLSGFQLICSVWVSAMAFRWFQYNPMLLPRGLFFLACLYAVLYIFSARRNGIPSTFSDAMLFRSNN